MNSGFRERHSPISFNGMASFPSQGPVLAFFRAQFAFPLAQRVQERQKANFGGLWDVLPLSQQALSQQGRWTPRLECVSPQAQQSVHQCRRVVPYIAGVMVRQKSLR